MRIGYQYPGAHRHGRAELKNAQHIREALRPAEIGDQENRTKRSSDEPHPETNPNECGIAAEQLRVTRLLRRVHKLCPDRAPWSYVIYGPVLPLLGMEN